MYMIDDEVGATRIPLLDLASHIPFITKKLDFSHRNV